MEEGGFMHGGRRVHAWRGSQSGEGSYIEGGGLMHGGRGPMSLHSEELLTADGFWGGRISFLLAPGTLTTEWPHAHEYI